MMIASPFWGALADRWGRKLMVERAMFGGARCCWLMAFVRSAEELVLLRAVQGLITGTIGAANALVAAVVPRERTGYAMGLLQVGDRGGGRPRARSSAGRWPTSSATGRRSTSRARCWRWRGSSSHWGVRGAVRATARPAGRRGVLAGWRQILSAPGVSATYSLRFLDSLARWRSCRSCRFSPSSWWRTTRA